MTPVRIFPTPVLVFVVALGALLVAFAADTSPVRAATHTIEMRDNSFTPRELTVAVGDTVTWTNAGQAIHDAVDVTSGEDAPAAFDSGNILAGESFTFTFTEPGTYEYRCTFHSGQSWGVGMVGVITVEAGPAPNTATSSGPSGRLAVSLFGAVLIVAGAAALSVRAGVRRHHA